MKHAFKLFFKSKWIITLILFLVGLFCYMKDYGYAQEHYAIEWQHISLDKENYYQSYESRSSWGRDRNKSNIKQHQKWQEEYDHHHFHAVRTYNDAVDKIWWLPNITWRQLGRDAWIATCSTAGSTNLTSAVITAFATLLSAYGLHCLDEWDYIQDKLKWAQYHFEECEKYAQLLHGGK